ncbi:hypothetical protein, partial [Klebsiella pneumoniae]|uniref:hypothetical protein n=1 Tax=Klebsiella pneumoniae TaxID=573 RepID=UPI001C8F6E07
RDKFEEWEGRLVEFFTEPPSGSARTRLLTKLQHLVNRLGILSSAADLEEDDKKWVDESVAYLRDVISGVSGVIKTKPKAGIVPPTTPTVLIPSPGVLSGEAQREVSPLLLT